MNKQSHFGVYGLILSSDRKQVLVVKKTKGPYKDWHDMPGGTLEEGETEEQALTREVQEETSATITDANSLWHSFDITVTKDSSGGDIHFHHTGKWKLLQVEGIVTGERDADDVCTAEWLPIADLLQVQNTSAPLMEALRSL